MCGISGIYSNSLSPKQAEAAVSKMNEAQVSRGPDDSGQWSTVSSQLSVVFGHRRLSILDLSSAGKQPMDYTCSLEHGACSLSITYNGEIYNFKELRSQLKKKGYEFSTDTDTEVILAGYAEWGTDVFKKLRGMFALGIWDATEQKLVLARDRYGIKPLYYYNGESTFAFSSTVSALKEGGVAPNETEQKALIGFLLFGSVPEPFTTLKSVFSLPAGSYMEISGHGTKTTQYYHPLDFFRQERQVTNNQLLITNIRDRFSDAVESHLLSDAPLGVFLSGGIDSSALAITASRHAEQRENLCRKTRNDNVLRTLSIDFEEAEYSERKYQDLVAEQIGSEHTRTVITKEDFYEGLDGFFAAMDQPTVDGVNTYFVAKAAKEAGLKAVLSGLGGDELFMGYSSFKRAYALRTFQQLPGLFKHPAVAPARKFLGGKFHKLSFLLKEDPLSFYLAIRGLFTEWQVAEILDISVAQVRSVVEELAADIPKEAATLQPAQLLSYMEMRFYLRNQLLRDSDVFGMAHSVEIRPPFLDHPLVECVSSLSAKTKLKPDFKNSKLDIKNSTPKPLLVAAMGEDLPREVYSRPKMGFTFPLQKWLREAPSNVKGQRSNVSAKRSHWSRTWAEHVIKRWI